MIEHTGEAGDEKGATFEVQDPGRAEAGRGQGKPVQRSTEHVGMKEPHVHEKGKVGSRMKEA